MLLNSEWVNNWDPGRNQKIPWNQWKWETTIQNLGRSESSPKEEIHNIRGLPEETRKSQINNSTLHLKELEKEQQRKSKVGRRKKIKDQSRNKWNTVKKNDRKDQWN